ncbi:hypothetical protein pb186bvf_015377 [Paramecium bursaria]
MIQPNQNIQQQYGQFLSPVIQKRPPQYTQTFQNPQFPQTFNQPQINQTQQFNQQINQQQAFNPQLVNQQPPQSQRILQSPIMIYQQENQLQQQIQNQIIGVQKSQTTIPHVHEYKLPIKQETQMSQQMQQQIQQQIYGIQKSQTTIPHVHEYKVPIKQQQNLSEIQQVQQVMDNQSTEIHELYHVERELQVLSVEDVEEPWKKKCVQLEISIYDLQTELARYKSIALGEKQSVVDDQQIQAYEMRLKSMRENEDDLKRQLEISQNEIDDWRTRYQRLQSEFQAKQANNEEVRSLRENIVDKDRRILKLEDLLRTNENEMQNMQLEIQKRDGIIQDLNNELNHLDQQISISQHQVQQSQNLQKEIDMWKDRFKEANGQVFNLKSELTSVKAELDTLKNKQTQVIQEKNQSIECGIYTLKLFIHRIKDHDQLIF